MDRTPRAGDEHHDGVRQQGVVADLGRRALEADDFDALLRDAAEAIVDVSRADYCVVVELLPGSELARVRAGAGWSDPSIESETVAADRATHLGSARGETRPVVANDLADTERFDGSELLERHDVSSGISVPVGPAEDPWGVLGAYATEPDAFPSPDANFVSGVAHALASAVATDGAGHRSERDQPLTEQVVETVGDGVYALDDRDRFVLVNDAFCELTGYDREALLGAHASLVHSEELNERARDLAEATTSGREEAVLELELRTAEGGTIPVESRFVPYEYREGRQGRTGITRDITDRKRFEETLTALYDTSRDLYRAATEAEVATHVVDAGIDVLDFTDVALYFYDDERGDLYPAEKATDAGFMWEELPRVPPDDSTLVGHAYASGRSVLEDDIRESPYFIDEETDMRAGVYAPIGDYGVVFAGSTTIGAFDERSRRLLELLAETAEAAFDRLDRERQLAASERRYRTLVENFPDGAVGLFDDRLEYTAVGGRLLDPIDIDPEDRVGKSIFEIHPNDLASEIEPHFRAALAGDVNSFEIDYRGRQLSARTLPVRDADDDIYAGMLVVHDVTERREMERELRESEAKFRMLAENLDEIVWMAAPDGEEFIYVNPAFEELWDLDRETLYDEPFSFLEAVHPDDRERVQEAFADLPEVEFDEEYRIVRPDGEVRWVHSRGARVQDEDGDVERVVGIGEDVTERIEHERRLEESERRYRTLAEHFPNGAVGVYDADLRYTLTEGAVLGDTLPGSDRLEGERMPEIFPEGTVADLEPLFRAAVEDGETGSRTTEFAGRNWRVWATPLRDADGEIFAGLSFAQDVTERVERERRLEELVEELEASNERLEQFAYAASHDLQEPLRMVSSYLQLIESRYADELDEEGEEFLEFAVDGAERMRDMIASLLRYSRVETRGDPFESVNLAAVLDDVLEDLQVRIEESDAEVTIDALPAVEGDRGQLRQVFQNLLDNALEYRGDEPPRVHIAAERDGEKWIVSVRDEGIGIEPDDADRIFDVFQRLHSRDEHPGTGIGLALCQRIVERHGGDIWVESEPGEGATFSFTLPVADESGA